MNTNFLSDLDKPVGCHSFAPIREYSCSFVAKNILESRIFGPRLTVRGVTVKVAVRSTLAVIRMASLQAQQV
jgi:hypothetical protein